MLWNNIIFLLYFTINIIVFIASIIAFKKNHNNNLASLLIVAGFIIGIAVIPCLKYAILKKQLVKIIEYTFLPICFNILNLKIFNIDN